MDPTAARPRAALVLLCGLPAAGKSSLARELLSTGPSRLLAALGSPGVRVWHVCFDAVLASIEARAGATAFDAELWHAARERVLAATRAHFARDGESEGDAAPALRELAETAVAGDTGGGCIDIVLLDDNMQYRSMRKAYYRIARDAGLGLCSVCLRIEAAAAIERDARRPPAERVGAATIRAMAGSIQWPEVERHPWESASITLDATSRVDDGFWRALSEAVARAVPPDESAARGAQAAASAAQTAESASHQLDLRLRRLTSEHMQSAEALALPKAERAALAKSLSERKRAALQACKRAAGGGGGGEADEAADVFEAAIDALEGDFARCFSQA